MDRNPDTDKEWLDRVGQEELKVTETMLSSDQKFQSASNLLTSQFLMMRVLWNAAEEKTPLSRLLDKVTIEQAKTSLKKNDAFNRYLEHLPQLDEVRDAEFVDIGTFATTRWQQLAINSTPANNGALSSSVTPTKHMLSFLPEDQRIEARRGYSFRPRKDISYTIKTSNDDKSSGDGESSKSSSHSEYQPSSEEEDEEGEQDEDGEQGISVRAGDEQIVNVALISLLDAIAVSSPGKCVETTSLRNRFRYNNLWTAITDGCLRMLANNKLICAIIEVKAAQRKENTWRIQRQEAGEMVAWMYRDSTNFGEHQIEGEDKFWRLLIAQDREELWIVIAEYDDDYKEFILTGKQGSDLAFMTMTQYGPFRTFDKSNIQDFMVFVQAFCMLQAKRYEQRGEGGRKVSSLTKKLKGMDLQQEGKRTPEEGSSSSGRSSDGSPTGRRHHR